MKPTEARALRGRLGMDQRQFARLIGVDRVSVQRWERYSVARITGTPAQVLTGINKVLADKPQKAQELITYLTGASEIGGLAFVMVDLFDRLLEKR